MVRGLDYYSKTAFEFVSDEIGSQSAIAGGGRYDKLVEFLDGRATPAVGFAIGIERLLELIKMPEDIRDGYYFGALDEVALETLLTLAQKMRQKHRVVVEYKTKNLKKHLNAADKENVTYCAIIGENELNDSKLWVKNLINKKENSINFNDI